MALRHLILRDFVIVSTLELEFNQGFTALTGETGAGKSILIDAIQMGLGERVSTDVIRQGASRAEVALFFDNTPEVTHWLEEAGFAREEELQLKRSVDAAGKSRAWINGSIATASQLRELADLLIEIHGQHAWAMLTRPGSICALLDAYGKIHTGTLTQAWQQWRTSLRRLSEAQQAATSEAQLRERLIWQCSEVEKLAPQEGEWERLNTEHGKLANAQALMDAAGNAAVLLTGDDTHAHAHAAKNIAAALDALDARAQLEEAFTPWVSELRDAQALVQDVAHALHAYLHRSELDPARLPALEERMGQWLSLARRLKIPPAALWSTWQAWREQLDAMDRLADPAALQTACDAAHAAYSAAAQEVHALRTHAAPRLGTAITAAMQGLGMKGGKFEVVLDACPPGAQGTEEVRFLVAAHAGAATRPIGKVASGGELSRIALAIAVTTSELGVAPTLVFDEIDAGIGGTTAHTVGTLLRKLGGQRQTLVVTHLPQVASRAHAQAVVGKHTCEGQTTSHVTWVEGEPRVHEIARMLGAQGTQSVAISHAKELLEHGLP